MSIYIYIAVKNVHHISPSHLLSYIHEENYGEQSKIEKQINKMCLQHFVNGIKLQYVFNNALDRQRCRTFTCEATLRSALR